MTVKTPSVTLVAEAYLRTKIDNPATFGVTTTLPVLKVEDPKGIPKDNWGGKQLWVTTLAYGAGYSYNLPVRKSVVAVIVWAQLIDRRGWGRAEALSEMLIETGTDWTKNQLLTMPYPGYATAAISSFNPVSVSTRIEGDPQELARVQFDAEITYEIIR